jgi:hypothetical protein
VGQSFEKVEERLHARGRSGRNALRAAAGASYVTQSRRGRRIDVIRIDVIRGAAAAHAELKGQSGDTPQRRVTNSGFTLQFHRYLKFQLEICNIHGFSSA